MYDVSIHTDRRNNQDTWVLVELACMMPNIKLAAKFLHSACIPLPVAHRVLLHPNKRRSRQ